MKTSTREREREKRGRKKKKIYTDSLVVKEAVADAEASYLDEDVEASYSDVTLLPYEDTSSDDYT